MDDSAAEDAGDGAGGPGTAPPAEGRRPLPTGIRAGEVTTWRSWRIETYSLFVPYVGLDRKATVLLRSLYMDNLWLPGIPMTGDLSGDDPLLGIHSFKWPHDAWDYLDMVRPFAGNGGLAFGQVLIWGDSRECKLGWRSSYASVHSIDAIFDAPADLTLERLQAVYPEAL